MTLAADIGRAAGLLAVAALLAAVLLWLAWRTLQACWRAYRLGLRGVALAMLATPWPSEPNRSEMIGLAMGLLWLADRLAAWRLIFTMKG
jgi:hypothetical protein